MHMYNIKTTRIRLAQKLKFHDVLGDRPRALAMTVKWKSLSNPMVKKDNDPGRGVAGEAFNFVGEARIRTRTMNSRLACQSSKLNRS